MGDFPYFQEGSQGFGFASGKQVVIFATYSLYTERVIPTSITTNTGLPMIQSAIDNPQLDNGEDKATKPDKGKKLDVNFVSRKLPQDNAS